MTSFFSKNNLILIVMGIILFISYAFNVFHIHDNTYKYFDRGDESNIISRLLMNKQQGFLSKGTLTGGYFYYKYNLKNNENLPLTLTTDSTTISPEAYQHLITSQRYDDYINNRKTYGGVWIPYKSQPGGQAFMYGILDKILPLKNQNKLFLFRCITIFLSVLVFILFIKWVITFWGKITGYITFFLILITPGFFNLAYNLWWTLWSYYIPFIILTLYVTNAILKNKKLSNQLYFLAVLTAFLKFFFTGAEFISTTLVMSVCPIIFYLTYTQTKIKESIIVLTKSSIFLLLGIILGMALLICQIRLLDGNWSDAFNHIIISFIKRSIYSNSIYNNIDILDVIKLFFNYKYIYYGDNQLFTIPYYIPIIATLILSLYFLINKNRLKNACIYPLAMTTLISITSVLTWIIIFKQHAATHFMIDYIIWYMPFLLYGYVLISITLQLIFTKIFRENVKKTQ